MKTSYKLAKELSQEFSITPQTVYRKIKQLNDELNSHIKKENGKTLFTEEAERVLRNSFSKVNEKNDDSVSNHLTTRLINLYENLTNKINQIDSEIGNIKEQNRLLQEENKLLQEELIKEREYSRQQAQSLAELSEKLAELTRNSQVLLKQEQDKNTLLLSDERPSEELENDKENKKSLWQKLFKAKKSN
ncbi:MAG: HTH domain-containing protein [Firmicutes bacterium]|nr:HTH domain-containing protein [Bacillota bacterium]MCL2311731.1 HTH domain-containing protein [Bacillota bacterium]